MSFAHTNETSNFMKGISPQQIAWAQGVVDDILTEEMQTAESVAKFDKSWEALRQMILADPTRWPTGIHLFFQQALRGLKGVILMEMIMHKEAVQLFFQDLEADQEEGGVMGRKTPKAQPVQFGWKDVHPRRFENLSQIHKEHEHIEHQRHSGSTDKEYERMTTLNERLQMQPPPTNYQFAQDVVPQVVSNSQLLSKWLDGNEWEVTQTCLQLAGLSRFTTPEELYNDTALNLRRRLHARNRINRQREAVRVPIDQSTVDPMTVSFDMTILSESDKVYLEDAHKDYLSDDEQDVDVELPDATALQPVFQHREPEGRTVPQGLTFDDRFGVADDELEDWNEADEWGEVY